MLLCSCITFYTILVPNPPTGLVGPTDTCEGYLIVTGSNVAGVVVRWSDGERGKIKAWNREAVSMEPRRVLLGGGSRAEVQCN